MPRDFWSTGQYTLRGAVCHAGGDCLGVEGGLLLRGWEGPGGARAALLAEDESHLLRRSQLRLPGTKGGAGLGQLERAQQVDAEEAFLTAHLVRPLGRSTGLLALRP